METELDGDAAAVALNAFREAGDYVMNATLIATLGLHYLKNASAILSSRSRDMMQCFNQTKHSDVRFLYYEHYMVQATHVNRTNDDNHGRFYAKHVPLSLTKVGGMSRNLPRTAWISTLVLCLHLAYQQASPVALAEDSSLLQKVAMEVHMPSSLQMSINNKNNGTQSSSLGLQLQCGMRSIWLQIIEAGHVCWSESHNVRASLKGVPCDLNDHWSFVDLNRQAPPGLYTTKSAVPYLVCNTQACRPSSSIQVDRWQPHWKISPSTTIGTESTTQSSSKIALLSSGWAYKFADKTYQSDESGGGGRTVLDWKRFLVEQFNLRWFGADSTAEDATQTHRKNRARLYTKELAEVDTLIANTFNWVLWCILIVINVWVICALLFSAGTPCSVSWFWWQ